ncbi:efflux RND transporter periplasmic adaptor subunit [bacterium]|nr:efflux RND transporter periplasmic adaptor subunit [bacterium]MBU1984143.1 efflux RND transporter periplasmic adaptor subunit [bacterium]
MSKPFKKIGIALAVLIVLGIGLRIVTKGRGEAVESIPDIQKREGIPVQVEAIQPGTIARTLRFSGTIEGEEQSVIVSRLLETVVDVPVRVGQRVSRGQVVARLDNANPQASYRQARSTLDNAVLELQRMKNLFEQGAVSKQSLDHAQLQHDIAQSNFAASAELIELRSPVEGEVVRIHLKAGDVASPGEPIVTVATSRRVRVKFYASASERVSLTSGQEAQIHTGLADAAWITGTVEKAEDAADPKTRLFEVTVGSDNPGGILKPGILTTVDVVIQRSDSALSIHREALVGEPNGQGRVFIVGADGRAALRTLTLGIRGSERVEVLAGLAVGDRVVTFGQNRLGDGNLVKIIQL